MKNKLLHSVELLRKAERLALRYDKEDGFFLAFSAGKDSQALYHVAKMAGVRFKAHINWTSVDPPQVIRFKRREYPDVVEKAPEWSIYDRAVQRGILPSMRIRWCCADFKETAGAGKVTLIGIRSEESIRRARRHEVEVSSKKFSGDLDQFYEWQEAELKRKEGVLSRRLKREKVKINEDEFSMMKENEVRCIGGKDSILISPIFDWTEKDVWYFLNEVVHAPHCELYDKGYKRIGCILCPMSSHKQKLKEIQDFPHVKRRWIEAIKAIRAGGVQKRQYGKTLSDHQWKYDDGRKLPHQEFAKGYIWWNIKEDWSLGCTDSKRLKHGTYHPRHRSGETRFCNSGTGNAQSSTRRQSINSSKSDLWVQVRDGVLQKSPILSPPNTQRGAGTEKPSLGYGRVFG